MKKINKYMDESNEHRKGFFKSVFYLDSNSKYELLNLLQYSLLSIIPIIIMNKIIQKIVPDIDENKSSIEMSLEISLHITLLFIGLFFINRIVRYIPNYSGKEYPEFEILYSVLSILFIILSLQTKIGLKMNLLVERFNDFWEGRNKESFSNKEEKKKDAKKDTKKEMKKEKEAFQNPEQNAIYQSLNDPPIKEPFFPMQENNEPIAANSVLGSSIWK